VTIEHNTFAGITWFGVGLRGKESTNGQIRNNIICDVKRAVLESEEDFTQAKPVIEYNLTFKAAPIAAGKNLNGKDPLFVDARKRGWRCFGVGDRQDNVQRPALFAGHHATGPGSPYRGCRLFWLHTAAAAHTIGLSGTLRALGTSRQARTPLPYRSGPVLLW